MKLVVHSWDRRDFLGIIYHFTKAETGAEIGVFTGETSSVFLRNLHNLKMLYLIDPYRHFPDDVYSDSANERQDVQDARYAYVCKLFENFKNSQILRLTSEDAAPKIPDNSLDFAYIDANHNYESVKQDLDLWWPKVKEGGILAGHDYTMPTVASAIIQSGLFEEIHWLVAGDIWVAGKGRHIFDFERGI